MLPDWAQTISLFNPIYIRSGTFSMSITGDFTGQSNKTILYQGFYADYIPPGTRVTFGGYMLNPSLDKIKNSNQQKNTDFKEN